MEKIYPKKLYMKINMLLIWPNLKYNHWPAKWFELLIDWLKNNWLKIKVISWFNFSIINFIYIFFTNKIYIISFPEKILYFLTKIFKNKKFIVWADIPLLNINISSKVYSRNNVLKIFNTTEIMNYYSSIYNKKLINEPVVHWHWINISIEKSYKNNNIFFLYYKNINALTQKNTKKIFEEVKLFLNKNNCKYELIEYWNYKYNNWIHTLQNTKYWIFITSIEWYWIAKLESLNYNIPMLNFEQNKWITVRWEILNNRSTFPIFEDWFWEKFHNFEEFKEKFKLINTKKYTPREIVKEKYCHIKKAKKLYDLYNKI